MSLILDALKRKSSERDAEAAPAAPREPTLCWRRWAIRGVVHNPVGR